MNSRDKFELEGLDELDTQLKLYDMGVDTFSPYAGSGKVDMIIRSEDGNHVRYADIKVCTGKREKKNVIWKIEDSFFMENESFIILTVRLPNEEEILEKHHFILKSDNFLRVAKKNKLKVTNDAWVIFVPVSDLEEIKKKSKSTLSTSLAKSLTKYFDNWDSLLEWRKK
jgi:hypothetical protein